MSEIPLLNPESEEEPVVFHAGDEEPADPVAPVQMEVPADVTPGMVPADAPTEAPDADGPVPRRRRRNVVTEGVAIAARDGGMIAAEPPAADRRPLVRERFVDEVRQDGDTIKVRVGERWLLVRPLGGDTPRFEQRAGSTFLIGRYQLRATRAPRQTTAEQIEGEGDLPEEAVVRPGTFLREARRRHRVFQCRPSGVEVIDGEPVWVTWIGDYRGLIPRQMADVGGPEDTHYIVRRRMENMIGRPIVVEVNRIDAEGKVVVLSREAARQRLARNKVEQGQRVRMSVRQVQASKVIGDIGGRDVVVLAQHWDGLFHDDLRRLPELQSEDGRPLVFEVEIVRVVEAPDGEQYCFGTRLPIVGQTWEDKVKRYSVRGVYGGVTVSRTTSGEAWFVELEEGLQAVCQCRWDIWRMINGRSGVKVRVQITAINPEQNRVYGQILGLR